jgi:transcriptional regulator with XRE-family HTH domain
MVNNHPQLSLWMGGSGELATRTTMERARMRMRWGAYLRILREKRNLSRDALAERMGCSLATIEKWERGSRHPERESAETLARKLQIEHQDAISYFVNWARQEAGDQEIDLRPGRTHERDAVVDYFAGRNDLLDLFKANLPWERDARPVLGFTGKSAVGKSSLLRMFYEYCNRNNVAAGLVSANEANTALKIMELLVEDLSTMGMEFPDFSSCRQAYFETCNRVLDRIDQAPAPVATALRAILGLPSQILLDIAESGPGPGQEEGPIGASLDEVCTVSTKLDRKSGHVWE